MNRSFQHPPARTPTVRSSPGEEGATEEGCVVDGRGQGTDSTTPKSPYMCLMGQTDFQRRRNKESARLNLARAKLMYQRWHKARTGRQGENKRHIEGETYSEYIDSAHSGGKTRGCTCETEGRTGADDGNSFTIRSQITRVPARWRLVTGCPMGP